MPYIVVRRYRDRACYNDPHVGGSARPAFSPTVPGGRRSVVPENPSTKARREPRRGRAEEVGA